MEKRTEYIKITSHTNFYSKNTMQIPVIEKYPSKYIQDVRIKNDRLSFYFIFSSFILFYFSFI